MKKIFAIAMAALLSLSMLTACGGSDDNNNSSNSNGGTQNIKISGSTSMEEMAKGLAERYMELNGGINISVEVGGSSVGIKNALDGVSDIGQASRQLKDDEKSGLKEYTVAIDGISVIVNPANGVDDISSDDLAKVFTGEITNWSELGGSDAPIVVIGREAGSGTRGAFEELTDTEDECKYAEELNETGAVKTKVASTEGAIGYVSMSAVDNTVKTLKLDGVEATEANAKSGSYTMQRPFIMVVKDDATGAPIDFINWILSDEGQELVVQLKLISVK